MTVHPSPRTKAEAILDIRYQIRLSLLHMRFYRRMRLACGFIALTGGSAALVSAFQSVPALLTAMGILVALASFVDVLCGFSERAAQHGIWRRQMCELLARADTLSLAQIDALLAERDADITDEIESLRVPAYNDNLRSNGFEGLVRVESTRERIMRALS